MPVSQMTEVLQHLRRMLLRKGGGSTDAQLLDQFIKSREESALESLVLRHGPMVWGVCRRILRNHHDAEDAFQATFLVLTRKAASVSPKDMLGNWLHGVAHRTALKGRTLAARRSVHEMQVPVLPEPEARPDSTSELRAVIDDEVSRLPANYRAVIVLCGLEGRTRTEAAEQLGVPEGTIASRLARAKSLLAKRLTRGGVSLSAAASAALLTGPAWSETMPPLLKVAIVKAGLAFSAGQSLTSCGVSAAVAELVKGGLKMITMIATKKLMLLAAIVLVTATLGSGIVYLAAGSDAGRVAKRQAVGLPARAPGEGQEQPGRGNGNAPQKTKPAKDNNPVPLKAFVLEDVWGLSGGQALWTTEDRTAIIQIVGRSPIGESGLWEKRYKKKLSNEQWAEVERLVWAHHFFTLKIPPVVPEKAPPITDSRQLPHGLAAMPPSGALTPRTVGIGVFAKDGTVASARKLVNDKHANFDPLYHYLLELCRVDGKPVREGKYDWQWRPDGFTAPEAKQPVEPETALADLPGLHFDGSYKVDPFIRAAVALQKMGKEKACEKMLELSAGPKRHESMFVLCRMLFTKKPAGEFRLPALGVPTFLGETRQPDWPLVPIELVDGVPFLITRGYALGGRGEHGKSYLLYCIKECAWNDVAFKEMDPKAKQAALNKLLAPPKWKVPLTDFEKKFLAEQIKPAKGPAAPEVGESVAPANSYKVDPYIQAAVAYQAMGKEKACEKLGEFAADPRCGGRAIVLCRMLFTKKTAGEFRRPLLGAPRFWEGPRTPIGPSNRSNWSMGSHSTSPEGTGWLERLRPTKPIWNIASRSAPGAMSNSE